MHIKYIIKLLCKSNPVTEYIYKKFAYTRADFREWKQYILPIYRAKWIDRVDVFLVLTPEHGNIGDHAIAMAEQRMLEETGVSYCEITDRVLNVLRRKKWLDMLNGKTILMQGGGYLGTLWFGAEETLREVIRANPKSTIYCFPNTIYFEKNEWGHQERNKSKAIYNSHPKLRIYAREEYSFVALQGMHSDVHLIPDVVLSLNIGRTHEERKGCLLCLRNDCEKTRTAASENVVVQQAQELFRDNFQYTDMCIDAAVDPNHREQAVRDKMREFSSTELVITDRLHGMIFCAITGTPCIVIDSKSPKVRGCYQWIEYLDYIKFCDDPAQIGDLYRTIPKTEHVYTNEHLTPYYDKLRADILNAVRR